MTNGNFCTVNKGYTCTFPETDCIQKKHHRHENTMFNLNKTIV
jgi:hypothetical protein